MIRHDDVLRRIGRDDLVLDVGGWAKPVPRADWVIDLMPYESRGLYGEEDREGERFTDATWVVRDICSHEPFPFADDQFDFAVCSHTLEDIRDPIWVCRELSRVARAGYVEVPSRLDEQSEGVHGPWVGWSHHRWLVNSAGDGLEFIAKPHVLHGAPRFRLSRRQAAELTAEERVLPLFWDRELPAAERVFLEAGELDAELERPVREWGPILDARNPPSLGDRVRARLRG